MNQSLRQTTLEAERLAIEFSRACAVGGNGRIYNAADDLARALDSVRDAAIAADTVLASYDHPPAEGFSEGVGA